MKSRSVATLAVAGAIFVSMPTAANAASGLRAPSSCVATRSAVLDEQSVALDRIAELSESLETDKSQLLVAEKYHQYDQAKERRAAIARYQPEYDLLIAQQPQIKKDLRDLAACATVPSESAATHARVRNLEHLRLYYVADLKEQKRAVPDLDYSLGLAKKYDESEAVAIYGAKLHAAKARIAKDKRQIAAIDSTLRSLRN